VAAKAKQIARLELSAKVKEDLKNVALGTSKINYMDPRITVAWCASSFLAPPSLCPFATVVSPRGKRVRSLSRGKCRRSARDPAADSHALLLQDTDVPCIIHAFCADQSPTRVHRHTTLSSSVLNPQVQAQRGAHGEDLQQVAAVQVRVGHGCGARLPVLTEEF